MVYHVPGASKSNMICAEYRYQLIITILFRTQAATTKPRNLPRLDRFIHFAIKIHHYTFLMHDTSKSGKRNQTFENKLRVSSMWLSKIEDPANP